MTLIRKSLFTLLSAAALVYLVLQTVQGQQWLSHTKQWVFAEPALANKQADVSASMLALLRSDIGELRQKMQTVSAEMQNMQVHVRNLTTENEMLMRQLAESEKGKVTLQAANKINSQNPKFSDVGSLPIKSDSSFAKSTNVQALPEMNAPLYDNSSKSTNEQVQQGNQNVDARQKQREQQARLQDVVQRMELTALQAITR